MWSRSDVEHHCSPQSCWIILHNHVYDVTSFLDAHPGGAAAILKYAGRDATAAFDPIHPAGSVEKFLSKEHHLGPVEPSPEDQSEKGKLDNPTERKVLARRLRSVINIQDFESIAEETLPPQSFAFLKTGADSESTTRYNQTSWSNLIRFRPRVLRPITHVNLTTTILDTTFAAPFFICPAGGPKLAHPDGERLLTRAAGKHGILHWVCNMSGCPQEELAAVRAPDQTLFWQIYALNDLSVTEEEVRCAVELGYRGFALTVDAIWTGKRERDMRFAESGEGQDGDDDGETLLVGLSKRSPVYPHFTWTTAITWLRSLTELPIAIKGIQTWEDALLCAQHGVDPWLSNHGGRQLDGAPTALETLLEIRRHCPEVLTTRQVLIDGGITRGTDIVKALALGARAVGLGRGFLFSLTLGEAGVRKAIQILKMEVETAMALLGVTSLKELQGREEYVAIRRGGEKL